MFWLPSTGCLTFMLVEIRSRNSDASYASGFELARDSRANKRYAFQ